MVVRLRWLALALGALVLSIGVQHAQSAPTELFFSEYIEGAGQNKALEIYNGTGASVDLQAQGYSVFFSFNGGTSTRTIGLTGAVANGDVYVIAQATADPAILAQADQTDTSTSWFNGDDFVALRKNGVTVDGIGQLGFDPGTEWGTGNTSTADNTIRRKPTVQAGDTGEGDAFDPATEWEGFPQNTFDGLGSHTITTGGDAAPAVASTVPANGATEVAENANVTINFSEPVSAAAGWYSISCASSGAHTATQSGGPQSYTLNPDSDFAEGEGCTVTVDASKVTDVDTDDPSRDPDRPGAGRRPSVAVRRPARQGRGRRDRRARLERLDPGHDSGRRSGHVRGDSRLQLVRCECRRCRRSGPRARHRDGVPCRLHAEL